MQGRSLIISLGLHGALVLAALVVLPNPEEFKPKPQESIQVDISLAGWTRRAAPVIVGRAAELDNT